MSPSDSPGETLTKPPLDSEHPTLLPRAPETTPLESSAEDTPPSNSSSKILQPSKKQKDTTPEVDKAIQAKLRQKREELNREIEVFRLQKDVEYREFEEKLRAEAQTSELIRDTSFDDQTAGPNSIVDGKSPKTITPKSTPKPPACATGHIALKDDSSDSSPPYEKELIGLFAPNFLPLLDSRYRFSPPKSPTQSVAMSSTVTATQTHTSEPQTLPKLKTDSTTPAYPLASSLKSSASSSVSTASSAKKPKSPKRVTFQFEDESSVPSRSSPPPSKVVWSLNVLDNDPNFEEPEDDLEEKSYVTTDDQLEAGAQGGGPAVEDDPLDATDDGPEVEQIENIANTSILSAPAMSIGSLKAGERYHGDELVTPSMSLFQKQQPDSVSPDMSSTPTPNNKLPTFKSPFSQLSANQQEGMNGPKDVKFQSQDDDDYDDGLFDLDETVPDEPERSPPHRDYSPLMIAATNQLPTISDFTLSSSVQPTAVPLPESLPAESLVFHKTMMQPPKLPAHRPIGQAGSLLTHTPFRGIGHPVPNPGAVAASLPPISNFPGFSGDSTHFRRRSINKYIPSPPPEEENDDVTDLAGKPTNGQPPPTFVSPFASSLPVSINPHFASLRSPPASTSPAVKATGQSPLSGRPSPNTATPLGPPSQFPDLTEEDDSLNLLTSSPPKSTNELDSYRRTDRFSSAPGAYGMLSPYRTKFAQEVAEMAFKEDGDIPTETPVGGVDGGTGLDPGSFSLRKGSLATAMASGRQIGGVKKGGKVESIGGVGSIGGGGGFSFSQRMAMEDEMAAAVGGGRR